MIFGTAFEVYMANDNKKMDRKISTTQIRRRRAAQIAKIALPAVGAGLLLWWGFAAFGTKKVAAADLRFSQVSTGSIEASVSATGRVVPAFEEVINSPVSSRILEVCHHVGDVVEAGTPLLVLDLQKARDAASERADHLTMKRLELEQQAAGDNTALSDLEMQIKVGAMRVMRLEAELANERYLDSIGSGTTDKVREADFALRSARLEQEQLRRRLTDERATRKAAAAVKQLEIDILAKEAALADRTLGEAEIRAPRRATITQIADTRGAMVNEGQQVATIADLGHYKVEGQTSDTYVRVLVPGARAKVRVGGTLMEGRVSAVVPTSQSGMISFTVSLDNDSTTALRAGLRPDVYVSDGIVDSSLRIANDSFYRGEGNYSLFVRSADGATLERRQVMLGAASPEHVQVISGLHEGEQVVVSDMKRFDDKTKLTIK